MNSEAMWSSVNYGVALNIIKQVFNNYEKFKIRGKKQMIVNRQEFSFEAMKDKLIGMVDEVMSDIPQEVKIKLPNLKSTDSKKLKLPTLKKG